MLLKIGRRVCPILVRNVCLVLSVALVSIQQDTGKCAVFDAFKVLPDNSTNFLGGPFALHEQDCREIIGESVQEIVALQWIFAHWNNAQKDLSSQVGLFIGDTCSRPKESVLQTLRFLDFVDFYEPKECNKKPRNGSMIGVLAPKDRQSATSLAGVLHSSNLILGAYTSESVEALLKGGVKRVLTTTAVLEDYISAFSALLSALESDLVIVVTCKEEDPRLDDVLKLLNEQEIHASEVIHIRHQLIGEVLQNTDSNILLYLPCDEDEEPRNLEDVSKEIKKGPKLLITIGIDHSDAHFPYRIADAQEVIIRQIHTELSQFKPYFLRILANNYDTYALASNYIQQLINCSFSNKSCPHINLESLSNVYVQGKNVDSIVRLAYSFAVASRFIDVDERLKSACANPSAACVDGVFQQLSSMRFVNEKRSPLELANEELGFFPKSEHLLQSIGIRLEAVLGGSKEIFKYVISREPKLIGKGVPVSIRQIRSVCQPFHTFCGNCEQAILTDPTTTFLSNQQVSSFYLAELLDLHEQGCENIRQDSIVNALAVSYVMNTLPEKHPNLALRPLKDYGALVFDSCSDAYRARQFTINTETQCLKLPLTEYNVSVPASTILSYVSTLIEPNNQASLLRGMQIPAVTMSSPVSHQDGVIGLLQPTKDVARAVAEFLRVMEWSYVSVVVSSSNPRSISIFEEFTSLTSKYGLYVENVLFYSAINRTHLNAHQVSANVTLFFTTSLDAAEFLSTRLRFNVKLSNKVDVMVGEALDFSVHDPNVLQHSGTIAIRTKDILPTDFKGYLKNVTPLSLPETWFWNYVEKQWRCALSLQNRVQYDGRLCTGNEHLNLLEFGQLAEAGVLIKGTEKLLLAIDKAYRKACGTDFNVGFCGEFLVNGRRLIREELNAEKFEVGFQVDELTSDHHGNLVYKPIGKFTDDLKYVETEGYRFRSGFVNWYQADKASLLSDWDNSTLNYVLIGITSIIICLSVATLFLVLYKIYSRVIKGNQSLGLFALLGIILMNLTAFLYIMDTNNELYDLRVLLNGFAHVVCFGLVLIKAIRLRNFEDICNKRKLEFGWNYLVKIVFIASVQLAIFFHRLDSTNLRESVSQGYTAFLLFLALLINVQNRKILRNHKESKWLFTVTIFALVLYTIWMVARTLLSAFIRQIDILELQLLSLILLIFLFAPKLYILIFFEGIVVERCETPVKPAAEFEDDLFATSSPDISSRSNTSRKNSVGHKSASTLAANDDDFPVLKTVMRKKRDSPSETRNSHHSQYSSDRNSISSST